LILLILVTGRVVRAHDEPFIVCDVTVIDARGAAVAGVHVFSISTEWEFSERKPLDELSAEAVTGLSGHARLQWPASENDLFYQRERPFYFLRINRDCRWAGLLCATGIRDRGYFFSSETLFPSGIVVDEAGRRWRMP
jgi:hypothetical protein